MMSREDEYSKKSILPGIKCFLPTKEFAFWNMKKHCTPQVSKCGKCHISFCELELIIKIRVIVFTLWIYISIHSENC